MEAQFENEISGIDKASEGLQNSNLAEDDHFDTFLADQVSDQVKDNRFSLPAKF